MSAKYFSQISSFSSCYGFHNNDNDNDEIVDTEKPNPDRSLKRAKRRPEWMDDNIYVLKLSSAA